MSSAARFFEGDEVLALLRVLPAREVARLRAVSVQLRSAVDAFTPELVTARGARVRARGCARLRELDREERAVLHEDFGPGWRERWRDGPTLQGSGGARYEFLGVREEPDGAGPTRAYLSMRAGGVMNFNGLYHAFPRPVKPRRIAFSARVGARCDERAFANVFFSAAPAPHGLREPMPFFYRGEQPEPPDLFTVLLDLRQAAAGESPPPLRVGPAGHCVEPIGELWLPTGQSVRLTAHRAHRGARSRALDDWVRLELDFDWHMGLVTRCSTQLAADEIRGAAPGPPLAEPSAHAPGTAVAADAVASRLLGLLRVNRALGEGAGIPFVTPAVALGFTHVFLFVWAEAEQLHGKSDVHISDLWVEE
ncbi:hypothetical protein KFE25_012064 [Diacronema lutheri]|uniref:Uncharacterized protein n=1 Tax=Diacronema lutheri TaxID=2081491 RepID=A0A8J5XKJ3_DIALT|nr:hypothetical protein KFE25_012064 [Diacronema lutheri]